MMNQHHNLLFFLWAQSWACPQPDMAQRRLSLHLSFKNMSIFWAWWRYKRTA